MNDSPSALPNVHEAKFVERFIISNRRERFRIKLADRKRRPEFLDKLAHDLVGMLDQRCIVKHEDFRRVLPLFGDPSVCHCIGGGADLDGREFRIDDVGDSEWRHADSFVLSFVPGELAFYEAEIGTCVRCLLIADTKLRAKAIAMLASRRH
ncbi:MAG TPA: hypothetical protein VG797_07260 [Phycisphaerales bacterium]|nr:hypothetical protein [Phycisphaerales bacterium]